MGHFTKIYFFNTSIRTEVKDEEEVESKKRATFEFTTFLSFPAAAVDSEVEAISRSEGERKRLDRISRTIN